MAATPIKIFTKDPDDIIWRGIDWTAYLESDAISASTWTLDTGMTIVDATSFTTTTTKIRVSGGTAGTVYQATNRITTAGGEQKDLTIAFMVLDQ